MPHFDIVKTCEPSNSFRVAKIQADFDVKGSHAQEHFVGDIKYPEKWNIGCIVGGSGTGKTTIARELFGNIGGGIRIPLRVSLTICRTQA